MRVPSKEREACFQGRRGSLDSQTEEWRSRSVICRKRPGGRECRQCDCWIEGARLYRLDVDRQGSRGGPRFHLDVTGDAALRALHRSQRKRWSHFMTARWRLAGVLTHCAKAETYRRRRQESDNHQRYKQCELWAAAGHEPYPWCHGMRPDVSTCQCGVRMANLALPGVIRKILLCLVAPPLSRASGSGAIGWVVLKGRAVMRAGSALS